MKAKKTDAKLGPLAVIEIGAHLARLQIYQRAKKKGEWETLECITRTVPFGFGIYRTGAIPAEDIQLAGDIACEFSRALRGYGVTRFKAVINGALREAANRDLFLARLFDLSGIRFECLEESEEVRLTFLAACKVFRGRYALKRHRALMCMIGPDVSQVLFLEKGKLSATETIRLGTLRLKDELGGGVSASRLRELIDPFVGAVLSSVARLSQQENDDVPTQCIALGSAVRALVDLDPRCGAPDQPVVTLSHRAFLRLQTLVADVPTAQLVTEHQLTDVVAASLDPWCTMLEHIFEITGADQLVVPMVSTRDALLQDLCCEIEGDEDVFIPQIRHAADHLAQKFGCDPAHAATVTATALHLFDELKKLHCLESRDRLLLELAARLHDAGFFISSRQHHKHSHYLVGNSELPGVSPREQSLIALVCRYHRKSVPRSSHPEFMALTIAERVRVTKLASMLRIADALDRSHQQLLPAPRIEIRPGQLIFHASASSDLALERQGLERKSDLFTATFGLEVSIQ